MIRRVEIETEQKGRRTRREQKERERTHAPSLACLGDRESTDWHTHPRPDDDDGDDLIPRSRRTVYGLRCTVNERVKWDG